MAKHFLTSGQHSNFAFNGCATCGAKCCSSTIIYASTYDIELSSALFPIFFHVNNQEISPVYFFYYGEEPTEKCPYLKNSLCSVYEQRPYACRTYPFGYENSKTLYDDGCPSVAPLEAGGMPIYTKDKTLNTKIVTDFISKEYLDAQDKVFEESENFVSFCLKNNFLAPYSNLYQNNPLYLNFKPSLTSHLYALHPQRIAVMRVKNKNLFTGHDNYLHLVRKIIASMENVKKLYELKEANK